MTTNPTAPTSDKTKDKPRRKGRPPGRQNCPDHIQIPGDVLIPDPKFCREELGGASLRTAKRYERLGLPFAMVNGMKWRPLHEGRRWVAGLIQRKGAAPKRGRR